MKKFVLVLFFIFLILNLFSQEIYREYDYSKLETNFIKKLSYKLAGKEIYNYTDNVCLYTDSTFIRKHVSTKGMVDSYEHKGKWKIDNDTLFLLINRTMFGEYDTLWSEKPIDKFLVKGDLIIETYFPKPSKKRKLIIKD